jgi:hypothetical protein
MIYLNLRRLGVTVLILGMASLAGCETMNKADLSQPKIYVEPLQAYVEPGYNRFQNNRLAIFPFQCPPHVPEVTYRVTEIFYRQLLKNWAFVDIVKLQPIDSIHDAIHLAKRERAELLMMGQIPYFLDSGTMGKSGLQVDLKVIEVSTGRTIWYLSDSISAEPRPIIDLWVTETKPKPSPGVYQLADMLAVRMVQPFTKLAPLPVVAPPPTAQCP